MENSFFQLNQYGITVEDILRNISPAKLYEEAFKYEKTTAMSDKGALMVRSGLKTGRSPKDKRVVVEESTKEDIWWGNVNVELSEKSFLANHERAIDYLNSLDRLYVIDGYAGWDKKIQLKIRVICTRPYHALFMHNMLIRPTKQELENFGEPDFVIYNAGKFPANKNTLGMTSKTSVCLSFEKKCLVILGTEYAGEMKKGVFTVMNYLLPKQEILSMHCSANMGKNRDVSLFFGLSGTGKTTLSADPHRELIGDDEHGWNENGIFNIEGGCYAKCIDLSPESEPEIFDAIRYGTILENVGFSEETRTVDYTDVSITENTRASYPIEYIQNAKIPCVGGHPNHIIFLTCDAFGILPPVCKLTPEQAMYHFISGYTAKVAGTEMGVTEPEATFSACFGAAFMVWHPGKYAKLLAENMKQYNASAWLINTGWTGGSYGVGKRISLKHTRAIIDAIHDGSLEKSEYIKNEIFGFEIPTSCPNVPAELLIPKNTWNDPQAYDQKEQDLANLFKENFKQFETGLSLEVINAGPK